AEQRIPNPRVGSSNLSTPAIFESLSRNAEAFSYASVKPKQRIPPLPKTRVLEVRVFPSLVSLKASAGMLRFFFVCLR
ncbi:hypothetical protein OPW33_17615, partial [Vibrio europaeus]|uniref:hypothetical protein n=1 Tax=Vibrio europaeus TaxID=300876 RepID=UPI00233FCE79